MVFVLGFTGTRRGMSGSQEHAVRRCVQKLVRLHGSSLRVVHGDCQGADAQFDRICASLGVSRGCRPADTGPLLRARTGATELAPPAPPLERNRLIVADATELLAGPFELEETQRSGTWATVRAARMARKRCVLALPDGSLMLDRYL